MDAAGIKDTCEHDCRRKVRTYLETINDPSELNSNKVASMISPHLFGFFVPEDEPVLDLMFEIQKLDLATEKHKKLEKQIQQHIKRLKKKATDSGLRR